MLFDNGRNFGVSKMTYFTRMQQKINAIKRKPEVIVLAIETSCDETAAAIVKNGREILSNAITTQIDLHKSYGGVVPELASRKHIESINLIIEQAMNEADIDFADLDAIAVTNGPGLVGALLVGVSTAKALAYALSLPLIGVDHIAGHISANYLAYPELEPPFLCLVVSGGHTHLALVENYCIFKLLGQTRDDAAGEAFDKVARVLGLGYPGGPAIDKITKTGRKEYINFPRALISEENLDFSFSGLKTAVVNHINHLKQKEAFVDVENISCNFQDAIVDVLIGKTLKAVNMLNTNKVVLAGGVAANSALREKMQIAAKEKNFDLFLPPIHLCTDNAAMIASAGFYNLMNDKIMDLTLNAEPQNKLLTKKDISCTI